jgi:hypothetical protein
VLVPHEPFATCNNKKLRKSANPHLLILSKNFYMYVIPFRNKAVLNKESNVGRYHEKTTATAR